MCLNESMSVASGRTIVGLRRGGRMQYSNHPAKENIRVPRVDSYIHAFDNMESSNIIYELHVSEHPRSERREKISKAEPLQLKQTEDLFTKLAYSFTNLLFCNTPGYCSVRFAFTLIISSAKRRNIENYFISPKFW